MNETRCKSWLFALQILIFDGWIVSTSGAGQSILHVLSAAFDRVLLPSSLLLKLVYRTLWNAQKLIMLITFASNSLGNNGLAPRGRFGNFASYSYLPLISLYALTMLLTVDSGMPNFAAASRLLFNITHLAICARLNSS